MAPPHLADPRPRSAFRAPSSAAATTGLAYCIALVARFGCSHGGAPLPALALPVQPGRPPAPATAVLIARRVERVNCARRSRSHTATPGVASCRLPLVAPPCVGRSAAFVTRIVQPPAPWAGVDVGKMTKVCLLGTRSPPKKFRARCQRKKRPQQRLPTQRRSLARRAPLRATDAGAGTSGCARGDWQRDSSHFNTCTCRNPSSSLPTFSEEAIPWQHREADLEQRPKLLAGRAEPGNLALG